MTPEELAKFHEDFLKIRHKIRTDVHLMEFFEKYEFSLEHIYISHMEKDIFAMRLLLWSSFILSTLIFLLSLFAGW
ncbi:hypothetical protein BegalDRAFT_3183 [Beggiatoa alba B18LD]|uniref:Uncharacterized protein n=1 Tax=Beggiatoa alba B18LD TaxID=395493 RepID=I3CK64_9GAMM|nr:hypothetical protein BegalDRAFT_3183 [Beggiatoa alba B18LD]